jgi:hypothetical protein
MKALPASSIWTEPAKQPHFVWAKDGGVVIQVIGNGPSAVILIQSKQREEKTDFAYRGSTIGCKPTYNVVPPLRPLIANEDS